MGGMGPPGHMGGASFGGGPAADPGLQAGESIKPGDWKCGGCGNLK